MHWLKSLAKSQAGATATEYVLLLGLIALVLLVGIPTLGTVIVGVFHAQAAQLAMMSPASATGSAQAASSGSQLFGGNWPGALALFVPAGLAWLVLRSR